MKIGRLALLCLLPSLAPADDGAYIQVLGIAQDAGYPQANCFAPHCMRAWQDPSLRRMASAIALVDERARRKYLFDATPDVKDQLYRLHLAAPREQFRLAGVFLTHAHIGHYTGLMQFGHEASALTGLPVYAMPRMQEFLSGNGPWDQLVRYGNIELRSLADGTPVSLNHTLTVTPLRVPHRDEYSETVGFRIESPRRTALFIPDIDKWQDWDSDIRTLVREVDYALLDATFYADGELPGRDMSAVRHPFVEESMALLADLTRSEKQRVIFIHMNHTNPLLVEGSAERETVQKLGFRIAVEGMKLEL